MNIFGLILVYLFTVIFSFFLQVLYAVLILEHFIKNGYIVNPKRLKKCPTNNYAKYITFVPVLNILYILLQYGITVKRIETIELGMSFLLDRLTDEEEKKYQMAPSKATVLEIMLGRIQDELDDEDDEEDEK